MEVATVGIESFVALGLGTGFGIVVPILMAIYWCVKKKENFTTILIGGAFFVLFALALEKPIQNALILPDHAVSRFLNARPVLWAFVVGLFPGVFEETGRWVAFKTVLKKRKNKETSISYGIGHGGIEVMLLFGLTYVTYISYAVMINTGTFQTVVDQVTAQAPEQLDALQQMVDVIAGFSFGDLCLGLVERVFAFLFHVGASILVFYAARDRKKIWLYPVAILLHTAMDMFAGLYINGTLQISQTVLEIFIAVFGMLVFVGAYILYKKDHTVYIKE